LATEQAAGLEVAGFEVRPRIIKIQVRGSVGGGAPGKFDAWLVEAKEKASGMAKAGRRAK
jgi:hypothetical protein